MHIFAQPQVINPTSSPTHMRTTAPSTSKLAMFASTPMYNAPCLASQSPCQQHTKFGATISTQPRHRPIFLFASASPDASNFTPQQQEAAQNLLDLVQNKDSTTLAAPTEAQLQAAVDNLISNGTGFPDPGTETMISGSGHWDVVHAPHINRMSSILGTKFSISYTLATPSNSEKGGTSGATTMQSPPQFFSNVKYDSPLFGSGWLSASGRLFSNDNDSVELHFDTFWVDEGSEKRDLRPFLTKETMNNGDKFITAIGRVTFFEGLAKFPVLYLDTDTGVSVFRFPPLKSNIAVVRQ